VRQRPGTVHKPDDEKLQAALDRLQLSAHRLQCAVASSLGMTEMEVVTLRHIATDGSASPGRIAELLNLSPGGAAALIQRLQRRGYLAARPDPTDPHSVLLTLSKPARADVSACHSEFDTAWLALVRMYSAEQRDMIRGFLNRAAEAAEHAAEAHERARGVADRGPRGGSRDQPDSVAASTGTDQASSEGQPMKAMGTGGPEVITLHPKDAELVWYRDAVQARRVALETELAARRDQAEDDWRREHLIVCDRLNEQVVGCGERVHLAGPCDLMLRLARDAARASATRLLEAVDTHDHAQLAGAASVAHACAQTLADAVYIDVHGLGEGGAIAL
jgi:DNA-binding MarR family transcriptional regulator